MTDESAVEMTIEPRRRAVGSGEVRRLLPYRKRRMVGPFIFFDLIGPDELDPGSRVDIDAHPHIGLSTVTYLFRGRLVHRDSTGAVQEIAPGAVNWMTAGSGVAHTERSHPDDVDTESALWGMQIWVALPDESQDVDPSFEHVPAGALPTERSGRSTIRVIAGTGWGLDTPVAVSSPLVLASIELDAASPVRIPADHVQRAALCIDGEISVGGRLLPAGTLAVLEAGSTPMLEGSGTAVVLGGEPVGERHIWWNFVHGDRERIEHAKSRWAAQQFPRVPGDHDPYVPLPGG